MPILQGTSLDVLGRGVGHYKDSAMPGQIGNFAVAGHRKTHGEPFRNLDRMRAGDFIVVETKDAWYTYREDRDPYIVAPTDVGAVVPVPDRPGATPTQRLITLTTCNPWWASTQRMIVVGTLTGVQPRSAGAPAVLDDCRRRIPVRARRAGAGKTRREPDVRIPLAAPARAAGRAPAHRRRVLATLVVVVLFGWVFPWVEPMMPFSGNTVSQ